MITFQQLLRKTRVQKPNKLRCSRFFGNPFKRGRVEEIVHALAPKKPNSAKRKIAYVKLSNGWTVRAKIPGQGFNIQKFSEVLVRGGRVRDLPGIHYILVKGKKNYSFNSTERFERKQKRSKYGLPSFRGKKYLKEVEEKIKHQKETEERHAKAKERAKEPIEDVPFNIAGRIFFAKDFET